MLDHEKSRLSVNGRGGRGLDIINRQSLLGGHLKNILFASPDCFSGQKNPSKFGSENQKIPILQFLKISEFYQG